MAKYQKYAEYKDSGEWLGEIPLHWDIQPTKRFFRLIAEPAPDNNSYELLSVYTEIGVKPRKELEQKGNKASTTDGYWVVKKGDIVVNKLLAWMGAVGYSEYDGVTSPAYDILRPTKKLNPKFYHYLFRTKIANMEFKRWSRGIMEMRLRLYFDELGRIFMPFPTFEEQNKIVDFLDHETAKIDTLIAKQEKLIELLKEKRQAVISHAVTKGLNPNVPMKDSGVEWLGEVPEYWEIPRLKQLIRYGSSISYGIVQPGDALDEGIPFIQTTNISKGSFELEDFQKTSLSIESNYPRSRLEGGEVILGIRASIGAAFVVPMSFKGVNLSRGIARIIPNNLLRSDFLVWFFKSNAVDQYWGLSKQGSTFSEVSIETVKELNIVIPPIKEQVDIANYIANESSKFEKLMLSAEKQKDLLIERRTALISAAVTGKIDVRNWQHPNQKNNNNTELSA